MVGGVFLSNPVVNIFLTMAKQAWRSPLSFNLVSTLPYPLIVRTWEIITLDTRTKVCQKLRKQYIYHAYTSAHVIVIQTCPEARSIFVLLA